jgi:signal transduction histidine kinase
MYGGEIMATNNPDGGTTVRFTLKVSLTKKEQL